MNSRVDPEHTRRQSTSGVSSLALLDLTKVYGGYRAVDQISLRVGAGEFFTLLGPSGSGKTTTLLMIGGFVGPTAGEVRINETVVNDVPPERRNIGLVFQNYALFPHLTVEENLAFPLEMRRVSRTAIKSRIGDTLALFRLDGQQRKYPSQLSGGQQQRVALARSLIFEPSLLLLDEPLGALDKQLRGQLQIELRLLQKRLSVTVVYVTHDQEEALTMSDRIAVMNHGRIEQVGTAAGLYEDPESLFVADFLGENNLFSGRVSSGSGDFVTVRLLAGLEMECSNRRIHSGSKVSVAVRPERVRVSQDPTAECRVPGVITEVIYVGSQFKYLVECPSIGRVVAVQANTGRHQHLQAGSNVFIGWQRADAKAFGQQDSRAEVPVRAGPSNGSGEE